MRIHAIACAAISIIVAVGCSAELATRPAAQDPSSPAAAEAPYVPPAAHAAEPPAAATPQERAVVYTCPMHPDVHSSTPGQCPRCGMTLVPMHDAGEAK